METLFGHGENMLSSLACHRNTMKGGQHGEPGNEEIFIDRNGLRFCYVLDYMRDRKLPAFHDSLQYEEVFIEAQFFQLDGLVALCQNGIEELTKVLILNACYNTIFRTTKTPIRVVET